MKNNDDSKVIFSFLPHEFTKTDIINYAQSSLKSKDNIYIDMQAGRNLLPKLLVADN